MSSDNWYKFIDEMDLMEAEFEKAVEIRLSGSK